MKDHVKSIGPVALVLLSAGAALGGIFAQPTFSNVSSAGPTGDPDNSVVTFTIDDAFTVGKLNWSGVASPLIEGTEGDDLTIRITAPNGTTKTFRIGDGAAFGEGTQFEGENFDFVGTPGAGEWTMTFLETGDNGPGVDAVWSTITFQFTDQQVQQPAADVTFCQLYGLQQWGKTGDVRGLAIATTSWNLGDADLEWKESPQATHPMIAMNAYRIDAGGRFQQIGQSWCKHGFFALSNTQCGGTCTFEPGHTGGDWLGQGCTDTYSSFLNSQQPGLGPRFEINPWTGGWQFAGSMFQVGGPPNTGIARRLQVKDGDMNTALPANTGATYLAEAFYVHFDDSDVWNSTAWKAFTPVRNGSGDYTFTMTAAGDFPNIGFAIDKWAADHDAELTVLAQTIPVDELNSPDGRAVVGVTATDNGDGTWHYEYVVLNIDMDRQIGAFTLDIAPEVTVTNAGFYAVPHHNEPTNAPVALGGIPIDNNPWAFAEGTGASWTTQANPLRWGTMYNFWFDADAAPGEGGVSLGLFRDGGPGAATEVTGVVTIPVPPAPPACPADFDDSGTIDSTDLNALLAAFGQPVEAGAPGDVDEDGDVDSTDLNALLAVFGQPC